MYIKEIIQRPEGRLLEFNETVPDPIDLAKTVISFANDSGGELYLGIRSSPREVIGLPESELASLKEVINNSIFNYCYPTILPDISFLSENDMRIIRIKIHKGNNPPYYLKDIGKLSGTYVRIGPSNRLAEENVIAELERKKRNLSFEGELVTEKPVGKLDTAFFSEIYEEKCKESPDITMLRKANLIGSINGTIHPTVALVLLSDDNLRTTLFSYAKIECRYFKGELYGEAEETLTIDSNILNQAEEAYEFVLKHINNSRTDYPLRAIKETLRNAVIHRDYSVKTEIKLDVYDNLIEITNPGLIPSNINYNFTGYRQSNARNSIIAAIFNKLGIIDKWGNGLKIIEADLKSCQNIEFKWAEIGQSFQVQFIKPDIQSDGLDIGIELRRELRLENKSKTLFSLILSKIRAAPMSKHEIAVALGKNTVSGHINRTISKLLEKELIEHSIPDSPTHPAQGFQLTERGIAFLKLLEKRT